MPSITNIVKMKLLEQPLESLTDKETLAELIGNGGTSGAALIVVLAFGFVAIIGILAAIAIPAYQDYSIKARLVQTYTIEREVALAVDTYYNKHQKLPRQLG